jgi:hypothetical protein
LYLAADSRRPVTLSKLQESATKAATSAPISEGISTRSRPDRPKEAAVFSRTTGCRFRNPAADAHCDDRNRPRVGVARSLRRGSARRIASPGVSGIAWIRLRGPVRTDCARPMRGLATAFVMGVENIDECSCDAIPIRVGGRGRALGRERDRQLARPRTNQSAPLQPSGIRVAASAAVPVRGVDLHMQTGVLARLVLGPATGDDRVSESLAG